MKVMRTAALGATAIGIRYFTDPAQGAERRRRWIDRMRSMVGRSRPIRGDGDRVPVSAQRRESLVDESSEGSFPASDPPSYWAREA